MIMYYKTTCDNYILIIKADNISQANHLLNKYSSSTDADALEECSYEREISNLTRKNLKTLEKSNVGDSLSHHRKIVLYDGIYKPHEICGIKNNGKEERRENQYIYAGKDDNGNHLIHYTGNWKCKEHTNIADVFFTLPE